ncbi:hypothetical protein PCE1_004127 [Barthelona sp. PCE]
MIVLDGSTLAEARAAAADEMLICLFEDGPYIKHFFKNFDKELLKSIVVMINSRGSGVFEALGIDEDIKMVVFRCFEEDDEILFLSGEVSMFRLSLLQLLANVFISHSEVLPEKFICDRNPTLMIEPDEHTTIGEIAAVFIEDPDNEVLVFPAPLRNSIDFVASDYERDLPVARLGYTFDKVYVRVQTKPKKPSIVTKVKNIKYWTAFLQFFTFFVGFFKTLVEPFGLFVRKPATEETEPNHDDKFPNRSKGNGRGNKRVVYFSDRLNAESNPKDEAYNGDSTTFET